MKQAKYDPRIAFCPKCNEHGHFIFPGVDYSLEFCSKEGAFEILNSFHVKKSIYVQEILKLRELVEKCHLPDNDALVLIRVINDVQSWNEEFGDYLEHGIVLKYEAHDHYFTHLKTATAGGCYVKQVA